MKKLSLHTLARIFVSELTTGPKKQAMHRLAQFIVAHKLENKVELLMQEINRELLQQTGLLTARVTAARPLSTGLTKQVENLIKQQSGAKEVVMNATIDPNILGGARIETPDFEMDLSLKRLIQDLEVACRI